MIRDRLHVLLIEDDEDDHVLVRDLLAELDHVEVALHWEISYEGGRRELQSGDYDVCLMDYRLGARDGIELLRELDASTPITPIVFLTGQDSRDLDVMAMEAGAADYLVKGKIDAPLLGRSIRFALERYRLLVEMHRRSLMDELTGVLNRRGFEDQMERQLKLARRRGVSVPLIFLDVDDFKAINDQYGHAEGDRALREVADLLTLTFRGSDIIARLGGDEFAVLLTEVRDVEAAGRAAHRVLDAMPLSAMAGGHEVPVAASVGLALFPDDGEDLEALLTAADTAMIRAKTESLGIQYYRPELRELLGDRLRLEQDMRRALERHEFQLHYQPVFSLETGVMVGAEALSRWRHFTRGMVAAAEFIELAETSGLIRSLDRWAMARAIHQRSVGLESAFPGWVAVNLSPQSLTDASLPQYVRDLLEEHGMDPDALVLEVPESAVGIDPGAVADLLWRLKDIGVAIALDNYGMGSTAFSHLKRLPIDIIKLDPELAAAVGQGESDERLVEGAIAMARGLRARILAKGVERGEQVDWLRDAGCDLIQGYFMSRPVPPDDLADAARTPAGGSATRLRDP